MALTLAGKIVVGLVIFGTIYFTIFIMPGMFSAEEGIKIEGKSKVKAIAFVKTFAEESSELNKTLAKLANDPELRDIFTYEIVVIDVEKEKARKFAITEEEVPCFIIGNEKVVGIKDENWFKKKILEVAKQMGIR
ncbi:MAG: hypothetical protein J7L44_01400 [Candidatus Diapherotrites archaeon]|nr:hypothetical protein [Candidatus Diapherotrites archaeon]